MTIGFREAKREDVPAVLALLRDDRLGAERETASDDTYFAAWEEMQREGANLLIVGELDGRIVATYQLTFISGMSLRATRRAQIESVRVAQDARRRGLGRAMLEDAEERSRAAGCALIQLTMHASRTGSASFYEAQGFTASHVGFKKTL